MYQLLPVKYWLNLTKRKLSKLLSMKYLINLSNNVNL